MAKFCYDTTAKKSKSIKKLMHLKKNLSVQVRHLLIIGLINSPVVVSAGMLSDDYNPYMGLSPFEQCMIYLSGDENIEQALDEELFGCGEKWGIEED